MNRVLRMQHNGRFKLERRCTGAVGFDYVEHWHLQFFDWNICLLPRKKNTAMITDPFELFHSLCRK